MPASRTAQFVAFHRALHPQRTARRQRFHLTLREDLGADDYRTRTGLTDATGYAFYRLAIADR